MIASINMRFKSHIETKRWNDLLKEEIDILLDCVGIWRDRNVRLLPDR